MADGHVAGRNLICGLHGWDYRVDTGISEYNNAERLHKFNAWVEERDGVEQVLVDPDEIGAWERANPQPYPRDAYLGAYQDIHGAEEEPHVKLIQQLARDGLATVGHHGPAAAMGVPRQLLPSWDDLQFVTAQLARQPLLDEHPVATEVVVGPRARRPLALAIPLLVSDMSFGALSQEAKVALAQGAELAGTGICSGEGGMLPDEQAANTRYFYELASARFGFTLDKVARCQAFHFKGGQGAKTGTGGHLPGHKVDETIAAVRGIQPGEAAISPATFPDLHAPADFQRVADEVRAATDGIPIGFKLSAQHIEDDIDFALAASADYIILDGRGGGTGAAPLLFRDNISVPTVPALARARRHLDRVSPDTTLIITGGLRTPADFAKALALGADAIALSNAALQAIGCLGMRACNSNNCPVGIATQKPGLRARLVIGESAKRLQNFLTAATELPLRPGPRLRPRLTRRVRPARPDHLQTRHGRAGGRTLRRRRIERLNPAAESPTMEPKLTRLDARHLAHDPWQPTSIGPSVVDAWRQTHYAAQVAAELGKSWAAPRDDDSHSNFGWVTAEGVAGFEGVASATDPPLSARLLPRDLTLALAAPGGAAHETFACHNRTLADAHAWLERTATRLAGPRRQPAIPAPGPAGPSRRQRRALRRLRHGRLRQPGRPLRQYRCSPPAARHRHRHRRTAALLAAPLRPRCAGHRSPGRVRGAGGVDRRRPDTTRSARRQRLLVRRPLVARAGRRGRRLGRTPRRSLGPAPRHASARRPAGRRRRRNHRRRPTAARRRRLCRERVQRQSHATHVIPGKDALVVTRQSAPRRS
jgi:glutamate synthase domain-containing protein 2